MTSREPSSPSMRYNVARNLAGALPPPAPTPPKAKRRPLVARIRVEPAKPKVKRDPYTTRWKDLTPEEMASFRLYPRSEDR